MQGLRRPIRQWIAVRRRGGRDEPAVDVPAVSIGKEGEPGGTNARPAQPGIIPR